VDFGDDRCQRSHFLMLHNILDRAHAAASIFDSSTFKFDDLLHGRGCCVAPMPTTSGHAQTGA